MVMRLRLNPAIILSSLTVLLSILSSCGYSKEPENGPSLCAFTTVGMGQKESSLWCAGDSCYHLKFARSNPYPARVGYYGAPVDASQKNQGDSLIGQLVRIKDWNFKRSSSMQSLSRNGGPLVHIPGQPANRKRMAAFKEWEHRLRSELERHPIREDSLVLSRPDAGRKTLSLGLWSNKPMQDWISGDGVLKMQTSAKGRADRTLQNASWESGDTLSQKCIGQVLAGRKCEFPIAQGVHSVRAILKIAASDSLSRFPNACTEGRFELVAEWSE